MSKDTLSANTLFHFTKSSDNLEGILKNEFYPRYCLENWDLAVPKIKGRNSRKGLDIAVPMVSFCDIPLSQIRNHVAYYGCYAIGLTKDWGMKNNICPVLYTYDRSELSSSLKSFFVRVIESMNDSGKNKFTDFFNDWVRFTKFVKPYEGYLWRDGKYSEKKIKFYDEREWRFCPDIPILDGDNKEKPVSFLSKALFLKPGEIQSANKLIEKFKLSFDPKDIKYIIVDKESEILEMVNKVIQIKQQKYSHADLQILTTRIISMEHIFEDF